MDPLDQIEVAQDQRRAFQDEDREAHFVADFEHAPREAELALGRLIVAGEDHVHRDPRQLLAKQINGVAFDLDDMGEVVGSSWSTSARQ
jgi:hypothetical protein